MLATLNSLRELHLWGCKRVTDAGVKELAPLKNLELLSLGPGVTDAGLKNLTPLKKVKKLYLGSSSVTDAGLKELAGKELVDLGTPKRAKPTWA